MKNIRAFITGILTILLVGAATANAATWTVTKATNSSDNVCDADCSLREAVFNADSGDTVVFNSNLNGQVFYLGGSEIVITKRITIDGNYNNQGVAFISGNHTSRHFTIQMGAALTLKNMTLVDGNGVGVQPGYGGAIFANNNSVLSLDRVAVRGNTAAIYGGAIITQKANIHIVNSSITGNSATSCLAVSLIESNVNMANVTISGSFDSNPNDLDNLGAVCLGDSNTTIRNSTIAKNSGGRSGLLFVDYPNQTSSTLDLGNTIVAENEFTTGGDVDDVYSQNTIISVGGNLIGSTFHIPAGTFTQPKDITGGNPLLAPLDFYSGFPVLSHSLQAGSPARNGGVSANAVDPLTNEPLTTDARGIGFPRITDTTVDKGAFEDQSGGFSLIVTKHTNSNDFVCDTDCSLREAVYQASVHPGTDTITFSNAVPGTILLGGTEILIENQTVNIVGSPEFSNRTVSGSDTNRIFRLQNATVKITGITLAGGKVTNDAENLVLGGAILASDNSHLTLDKMIVRNNYAIAYGAIYLDGDSTGHITNSTVNNNSAVAGALAIGVGGTLNMANTTVSGNFNPNGNYSGGAIYVSGTANIRNSTIAFNRAGGGTGGGILSNGTLNIANSIVSNNIAATSPDIHFASGTIISAGGNLILNANGFPAGTFAQTNDVVGIDPLLSALQDNGGNITTHALMPNSPAVNSGVNANATDPFDNSILMTDARGGGFARIVSVVDKGAFESLAPTAASVSISGIVTNGKRGIARARVYLTGQNGETRTAITNSFGYFSFSDVQSGETYIVNVISKSYLFTPRVVSVNEDLTDLDFSAEPNGLSQQ